MSGSAPRLDAELSLAPDRSRAPIENLLHALNQPLTGLQCSMELAVAGPHPSEYYRRTLEEGLELVGRARALVGALREIVDLQDAKFREVSLFRIDSLVREIVAELGRVGMANGTHLQVFAAAPLSVYGSRTHISNVLLRLFDSVLALTAHGAPVNVAVTAEIDRACLMISWTQSAVASAPFSLPELGLLISQTGWERAGGTWARGVAAADHTFILCMPLASSQSSGENVIKEEQ